MSAPISLQQQQQQHEHQHQFYASATSCKQQQQHQDAMRMSKGKQIDLIEAKFNQLARKILLELQQNSAVSQRFFGALDSILQEPEDGAKASGGQSAASGRLSRSESRKQLEQQEELARKCDILLAKQKMQQDQLDNHQQILFDKQFESLPAEVSARGATSGAQRASGPQRRVGGGGGGVRKTATTSQLASSTSSRPSEQTRSSQADRQRSAIPTSTILSGISQLSKSASTAANFGLGASSEPQQQRHQQQQQQTTSQLSRQSSLRANSSQVRHNHHQAQTNRGATAGQPAAAASESQRSLLGASEKLKQRRPTKAAILDTVKRSIEMEDDDDDQDDEDDDDDDDDDDDSYEYQNLASRRAYLNQRFVEPAGNKVVKSKTFSELKSSQVEEEEEQQQQQQQQPARIRLSLKSATGQQAAGTQLSRGGGGGGGGQQQQQLTTGAGFRRHPGGSGVGVAADREPEEEDLEGPRSINGLLTSRSGSMMYKGHMNYSQSLLGNHRLSDDDEIIIIPTAHSPTPSLLLSASPSPVAQHRKQADDSSAASGNLDELNERFSISRTKSFWEKLANSKRLGGAADASQAPGQAQQANSAGADQQGNSNSNSNSTTTAANIQPKLIHQQHSSKSAFDRLDSTGGSSSHQSGCSSNSSTSGDEPAASRLLRSTAGANWNQAKAAAANAAAANARQPAQARSSQRTWPNAPNPTISQLVSEEQMQRSDRFRQTR